MIYLYSYYFCFCLYMLLFRFVIMIMINVYLDAAGPGRIVRIGIWQRYSCKTDI